MDRELRNRLTEAGVDTDHIGDSSYAWRLLHERFGGKATILDRYAIEADQLGINPRDLPGAVRETLAAEVMAARSPGIELLGERRGDPIQVVPYDPSWPATYAGWESRLAAALDPAPVTIDHIGSTSVPGLAAKPIVDILVGVADPANESSYVPAIESTGLILRSREQEHRFFYPPPGQPRTVHIHVCAASGPWATKHLLFRDYLRSSAAVRDQYADLKATLAEKYRNDRMAYTDVKARFILDTLHAARRWADATGRSRPADG